MDVNTKIPVYFEKIFDYDDRFKRYKIWVLNIGRNHNYSTFTKESVLRAIPSLYNMPLLTFIEENSDGELDFSDHRMELVVKDGEIHYKYLGSAIGTIPQDCNPQFESRTNELGGIEEYLTIECIVWTRFEDAIDILERDATKNQSMELSQRYTGKWDNDGYFIFEDFAFTGFCLLGKDYQPGIPQSTIENLFSKHSIKKEIEEKMSEYSHIFEKHLKKDVLNFKEVDASMTFEKLLAKYSITTEQLSEKGIVSENFSIEELETKIKEVFSIEETEPVVEPVIEPDPVVEPIVAEPVVEPVVEPEPIVEPTPAESYTRTFELSHDDIRRKMYDSIDSHMESKGLSGWHYISSVYDNYVVVESDSNTKHYKVDYAKENENITFGDVVEVFGMFLTSEEKGALELLRANFTKLEEENIVLKEFQSKSLKSQHEKDAEELFSNFSKLAEEDLKEIRENIHDFTIEQIETKCFELVGRKTVNFSKKDKQDSSIRIIFGKDDNQKSSIDSIFEKHGIIK